MTSRSATPDLPLGRGATGEAVRDLQIRLGALGEHLNGAENGSFDDVTEQAVRSFQAKRGLRVDGSCGDQTWSALVEAGYRIGDRLLYHRAPMLRGDDVAELQRRLSALGFDAGRNAGILGPETVRALEEFQRNAGLTVDGICGPTTLAALDRLGLRDGGPDTSTPVVEVREREALRRAAPTLVDRVIAVGHTGGLDSIAASISRGLSGVGARVIALAQADESDRALAANAAGADAYVGIVLELGDRTCVTSYWRSPITVDESIGGRRLSELLAEALGTVLETSGESRGMALPVLRETRMPAVICHIGPPALVVERAAPIADAVAAALARWAATPC